MRKDKMRFAAVILSLVLAMGLLAACGSSSSSSSTTSAEPAAAEPTETADNKDSSTDTGSNTEIINVAIWDNNQLAGLQEIADAWSAKSGIKVNIDVITWNEYWTLLEAGASGGTLPDVFWMHINEAQKYMNGEMLLNLDDYIAADDAIDLSNYYEGIVDLYSLNGTQYAIPKDHDTIALLYNKTIFDKYGVAYPTNDWTWDDFAAAAAEISEKGKEDGVYGTAVNTDDGQNFWHNLIYDFGGKLISEDKKSSGMDDENTLKGMKFLAEKLLPTMPNQNLMADTDPDVMFLSGKVAMLGEGSWMVQSFYDAEFASDYAWAELPYYDANGNGAVDPGEKCTIYNGLGWAAAYNTKDPQAAYDLISAFCCEEGQIRQSELGVTMAAYKGASEPFIEAFEGMDISPFFTIEESGTMVMHPASRYTTAWDDVINKGLVAAWQNPDTMEDVCKDVAVKMNEILATE